MDGRQVETVMTPGNALLLLAVCLLDPDIGATDLARRVAGTDNFLEARITPRTETGSAPTLPNSQFIIFLDDFMVEHIHR